LVGHTVGFALERIIDESDREPRPPGAGPRREHRNCAEIPRFETCGRLLALIAA